MTQTITPEMRDTMERDEVRRRNADALSALQQAHGLVIQASDYSKWRPTVQSSGRIPGVAESVTIIATNGVVGYFLYDGSARGDQVLFGHIQCFDGDVETLYRTQRARVAKEVRVPKSAMDKMLELLGKLKVKT